MRSISRPRQKTHPILGVDKFISYLEEQDGSIRNSKALVYCVVNRNHRGGTDAEMTRFCTALGLRKWVRVRLNKSVGLENVSTAVLCQFGNVSGELAIRFKSHATTVYREAGDRLERKGGYYKGSGLMPDEWVETDEGAGWTRATHANAQITPVNTAVGV